jgi:hypothetical protein
MAFNELKHHSLIRLKELPLGVRFAEELMFKEEVQLRADCLRAETGGQLKKPIQKGLFCEVWRRTNANMPGYERFIAELSRFSQEAALPAASDGQPCE